jgi:hypothetical protein
MGFERGGTLEHLIERKKAGLFQALMNLTQEISCFLSHLRDQSLSSLNEFGLFAFAGPNKCNNGNGSHRECHSLSGMSCDGCRISCCGDRSQSKFCEKAAPVHLQLAYHRTSIECSLRAARNVTLRVEGSSIMHVLIHLHTTPIRCLFIVVILRELCRNCSEILRNRRSPR